MDQQEPALSQRELTIVRGMIDEHLYRERRSRFWASTFGDLRWVGVGIAGLTVFAVNVATLYVLVRGR